MVEQHVVYSESQPRRIFGLLQPEKKAKGYGTQTKLMAFQHYIALLLCSLSFLLPKIDRNCISMHILQCAQPTCTDCIKCDSFLLQTKIRCFF